MSEEHTELCNILKMLQPTLENVAVEIFRSNPDRFPDAIEALERVIDLRKKICD